MLLKTDVIKANLTKNKSYQKGEPCHMTTYQNFLEKLVNGLSRHYGEQYKIKITQVKKNNGVIHSGITITYQDSNISPTIYMEELYERYLDGEPLSDIMRKIMRIYDDCKIEGTVDTQFICDFEKVRDRIVYKLIGYETNRELLRETPHIPFLDMAIVCYVSLFHDRLGSTSVLIRNDTYHMWGIDEKELLALAEKNTPRILPADLVDMRREVKNAAGEAYEEREEAYMYLLTNRRRQYGAACILYPQVLAEFAGRTGKNFYILPGSVHEMILVPERRGLQVQAFREIVRSVNRTQLCPEEVLTDSVYFYDRKKEKILILDNSEKL